MGWDPIAVALVPYWWMLAPAAVVLFTPIRYVWRVILAAVLFYVALIGVAYLAPGSTCGSGTSCEPGWVAPLAYVVSVAISVVAILIRLVIYTVQVALHK